MFTCDVMISSWKVFQYKEMLTIKYKHIYSPTLLLKSHAYRPELSIPMCICLFLFGQI